MMGRFISISTYVILNHSFSAPVYMRSYKLNTLLENENHVLENLWMIIILEMLDFDLFFL